MEPIAAVMWRRQVNTLDKSPVHGHAEEKKQTFAGLNTLNPKYPLIFLKCKAFYSNSHSNHITNTENLCVFFYLLHDSFKSESYYITEAS